MRSCSSSRRLSIASWNLLFFFCLFVPSLCVWPDPQGITIHGSEVYGVLSHDEFKIETNNGWVRRVVKRYVEGDMIFPFRSYGTLKTHGSEDDELVVDHLLKKLSIQVQSKSKLHYVEQLQIDMRPNEEYVLSIQDGTAELKCEEAVGCIRGLETFSQIVRFSLDESVYFLDLYGHPLSGEAVLDRPGWLRTVCPFQITDKPKFPWRGVMLDTSRHFIPPNSIASLIDVMAYNKFNVLHWHATDAEAYPLNSTAFPELAKEGSWTPHRYYTTYTSTTVDSMTEYAASRGVRVVLELDTPGHTASWKGLPNITLNCSIMEDGMEDGIAILDPTSNETYTTLKTLFKEYTGGHHADSYFHLGGDDVDTSCWENSTVIQDYLETEGLTIEELLASYHRNVLEIFSELNDEDEKMERHSIVWEDVLQVLPGASAETVQLWREEGTTLSLGEVLSSGRNAIASRGWCSARDGSGESGRSWSDLYTSNQLLNQAPTGYVEEDGLLLGGEVCLWGGEFDRQNLEQVVWPSASAAGERMWTGSDSVVPPGAEDRLALFRCRMAQRGFAPSPVGAGYCPLPAVDRTRDWTLLLEPATFFIVVIAVFCISVGSFRSLEFMRDEDNPMVQAHTEGGDDSQIVNGYNVLFIPIFASCTLLLLYFFLDTIYLVIFAMVALSSIFSLIGLVEPVVYGVLRRIPNSTLDVRLPYFGRTRTSELIGLAFSIVVLGVWFFEGAWYASDLMGISLAIMGLTYIQLPNLKISLAFLWIFFFYDLFWVFLSPYIFGQSVMENVAINLASPEKTTRPLPIALQVPYAFSDGFQLIGLGDIVLPGCLIALMLRFDNQLPKVRSTDQSQWLRNMMPYTDYLYFWLTLICYVFGIYTCLIFLIAFNTAQPALIYLVPFITIPAMLMSWLLGDLTFMWSGDPIALDDYGKPGDNTHTIGEQDPKEKTLVGDGSSNGEEVIELNDLSDIPQFEEGAVEEETPPELSAEVDSEIEL